jgi:ABC-2 type transport system permease protein
MGGMRYMDFIVPGLVMMAVIQNSYGNISSSFFGAKFQPLHRGTAGQPDAELGDPRRLHAGAVLRGLMVGAIVLALPCCSPACACRIRW